MRRDRAITGCRLLCGLLLAAAATGACRRAPTPPPGVTVFAAASTTDAMSAIAARFEADTGTPVRLSFAASSTLARQIEHGARADVFVSASEPWMDHLAERSLIEPASRRDLFANRLVLIRPLGGACSAVMQPGHDLEATCPGRIAIGDPQHVPAGLYARQALRHLGWWEPARPRLVPTVDVRAALRLVQLDEVDAGIVYESDASSPRIEIVGVFPAGSHDPIRYPVALVRGAGPEASAFLRHLLGSESAAIAARHGLSPATVSE